MATPARQQSVSRYADVVTYPSSRYLKEHLLAEFCFKFVSGPIHVDGDPVSRFVCHCRKRLQTVIFVKGSSGSGKSSLVQSVLTKGADKVIPLDRILFDLGRSQYQHSDLEMFVRENINTDALGPLYDAIDLNEQLRGSFAQWICRAISPSDKCVVIEGYIKDMTKAAISSVLGTDMRFWDLERS